MKKQANQIKAGDMLNRYGYGLVVKSVAPANHPIGGNVIQVTAFHSSTAGRVVVCYKPEALVELCAN